MIRLKKLLKEVDNPNPVDNSFPFFNKFREVHGYNIRLDYIGQKNDQAIYKGCLSNLGQMELIASEAHVIAKITEKVALFGVIYLLKSLEECESTICRMTLDKNGMVQVEHYDKKNFKAADNKFLNLIENK